MLDHVEQRLLGPVHVLEHQHERLCVGELLGPPQRGPAQLPRLVLSALGRTEHTQRSAEEIGDRLALARGAQLLERLARRVVVADPGARLDHRRQRPVRDALAIGERAPPQRCHAFEPLCELGDQAGLAETGLAEDRQELAASIADGAGERVLEQRQFRLTADERRGVEAARVVGPDRPPCPQRLGATFDLERSGIVDLDRARRQPARGGAEEDLARLRRLLETRRKIDRLARREGRIALVDDDLARLDADADGELQLLDFRHDLERRAHGTLGVVLVRDRHTEGRHHRVARELLDRASVRFDASRDDLEVAVDALADDFGIRARDEACRVDEIGEEDGCDLAFDHGPIVRAEAIASDPARG